MPVQEVQEVHETTTEPEGRTEPTRLRRGPLTITALVAALGGAAIYSFALPALWRMAWPYGLLFTALGLAQLGTAALVLARPRRRRVLLAVAAALAVLALGVAPAGPMGAGELGHRVYR
jgi:peptidoglycan/LPS O-acetylase OafA/YrhL